MSGKRDVWMPLYIADYLADTTHLSTAQHGAYLLLIMVYWKTGPLPDNDKMLARMARCDQRQWATAVGPTVREFFEVQDGKLFHKRVEKERAKAISLSEVRRQAGLQGRSPKTETADSTGPIVDAGQLGQSPRQETATFGSSGRQLRSCRKQKMNKGMQTEDASNPLNSPATGSAIATPFADQLQTHARDAHARGLQSQSPKEDSVLRTDAGASLGGGSKAELFRFGAPAIARLAGLSDRAARSLLGRLMQIVNDDAPVIMALLQEAEAKGPADPVAWLIAAAQARAGVRLTGAQARKAEANRKLADWIDEETGGAGLDAAQGGLLQ